MKKYIFLLMLIVSTIKSETGMHLTVKSYLCAGFFSELWLVVDSILDNLEQGLTSVKVDWHQPFYPYKNDPSENGWDLFFKPINLDNKKKYMNFTYHNETGETIHRHQLHNNWCRSFWMFYDDYLDYRVHVNGILKRYIHIKSHLTKKIDAFYTQNMEDHLCIGIHVRYCKLHGIEVPEGRVPELEEYYEEVDKLLSILVGQKIKLYIASDSDYAINAFKEHYGSKIICIPAFRDEYRGDPHLIDINTDYWLAHPDEFHAKKPGYKGGEEALMDCLLLSKCDYFIHTSSNLAAFVSYFNPYIKSIFLPRDIEPGRCKCSEYVIKCYTPVC